MDSFKDLLTETVGQIKRANEYFAEQQMKEIKKLKCNEPRKFKKKANEDQFQRIHSADALSESSDTLGSAALTGTLVPPL